MVITNGNGNGQTTLLNNDSNNTTTTPSPSPPPPPPTDQNDIIIIEKQREYIKLLENEIKSLREHFQSSMERIMSNPLFVHSKDQIAIQQQLPSSSSSSLIIKENKKKQPESSSPTTPTQASKIADSSTKPNSSSKQKGSSIFTQQPNTRKRKFQQLLQLEREIQEELEIALSSSSEEDEEYSTDDDDDEESTVRKTRQQSKKVVHRRSHDSDEEPIIDNIFDMNFWNREIAKWRTLDVSSLPKVKTPKEGTKQVLEELEKMLEKQVETTPNKSKTKTKKTKEHAQQIASPTISTINNEPTLTLNEDPISSNSINVSNGDNESYLFDFDDEPVPLTEPMIKAIGTRNATKIELFTKLWEYLYNKQMFNERHRIHMDPLIRKVLGISPEEPTTHVTINEFNRNVIEQLRKAYLNQKKEDMSEKFKIL